MVPATPVLRTMDRGVRGGDGVDQESSDMAAYLLTPPFLTECSLKALLLLVLMDMTCYMTLDWFLYKT